MITFFSQHLQLLHINGAFDQLIVDSPVFFFGVLLTVCLGGIILIGNREI